MRTQPISQSSILLFVSIFVSLLGLLSIYSASSIKGFEIFHDSEYFLKKQSIGLLLSFFIIIIINKLPLAKIKNLTNLFCIFTLILLSLILVPGLYRSVGGASRWLDLKFFRVQTSEFAKLALVFFLAKNLSRSKFNINKTTNIILPMLFLFSLLFFLMLQPDLGTSVLITVVFFFILFVSGISRKFIAWGLFVFLSVFSFFVVSKPYRLRRIIGYLDPWSTSSNEGFQIVQSFLAFRNGGFGGIGLGSSKQKLYFLPEAHTDFILSVIAEELGFLGTFFICLSYFVVMVCSFKISLQQKDLYLKLLSFGCACMLSAQIAINLGVVTGVFPTKGMSLPFLSSGITSLVVSFIIISILAKIDQFSTKLLK